MGFKRRMIKQKISHGSNKSAKELASCFGKIRHNSYNDARDANKDKIDFVKPYKCQFCSYYHVGRRKKE